LNTWKHLHVVKYTKKSFSRIILLSDVANLFVQEVFSEILAWSLREWYHVSSRWRLWFVC